MSSRLVFLSHIHEESELAILVKQAIESEFGGFVDVFVSSDGTSIPAGSNFLKRIEAGLLNCIGAMYLISPNSVKRNWINFELGAIWLRNLASTTSGGPEIPTLPMCHSGITPSQLPAPLNNLNAITASEPSSLEFAFRSIQTAVGGKGQLRTDFHELSSKIREFEGRHGLGDALSKVLSLLKIDRAALLDTCEKNSAVAFVNIKIDFLRQDSVDQLKQYEAGQLKGNLSVNVNAGVVSATDHGMENGASLEVQLSIPLLLQFKKHILG